MCVTEMKKKIIWKIKDSKNEKDFLMKKNRITFQLFFLPLFCYSSEWPNF